MKFWSQLLGVFLMCSGVENTFGNTGDSVPILKKEVRLKATARFHSLGMFNYGGVVGSVNPVSDFNLVLERPKWGVHLFKGIDLKERVSFYNSTLLSVFKSFKLTKKITITPYVGVFLEQSHGFADPGSDVVCIITSTFKFSPHLSVEHMNLFGNLVIEPLQRDWVNRFRFIYTHRHLDVVPTLWYNSPVFDHSSRWSAGANVAYSRMKVAEHISLSAGITGLMVFTTRGEPEILRKSGLMFSLALQYTR